VNCFDAPIPEAMCEADKIEVLSLNGLGAAKDCKNVVKFPFSGVSLFNSIGGTLPSCVWELRNLTVLHATGNGLTGSLVGQLPPSSLITDLSLSHNKISGTIPAGVQSLLRVDLSYNQLSGGYDDSNTAGDEPIHDELILEINRLSGRLPVHWLENVSVELQILRGNMFSCPNLPANDEFVSDYICGSSDLNESMNAFFLAVVSVVGCMALVIVLCFAALHFRSSASTDGVSDSRNSWCSVLVARVCVLLMYMSHIINQTNFSHSATLQSIGVLCKKLTAVIWLFVQLLMVVLVMSVPIYAVRMLDDSNTYSTHTHTYAWFWTLAYMRGVVPSSLLLVLWVFVLGVLYYHVMMGNRTEIERPGEKKEWTERFVKGDAESSLKSDKEHVAAVYGMKTVSLSVMASILNVTVVTTVNILYIYLTQQALSPALLFGIQLSLAVFRLVYARIAIPLLSVGVVQPIANIVFRFRLLTICNFIIPCIVTAFASPSCFQVISIACMMYVLSLYYLFACLNYYLFYYMRREYSWRLML
jgi:hypothetical protein